MAELIALQSKLKAHLDGSDAQVALLIKNLERFLEVGLEEIVGQIETGDYKAQDAAAAIGSLLSQLEDAGLKAEIGKLRAIYGTELRFLNNSFSDLGFARAFADSDRTVIDSLIGFDTEKIASHVNADVNDIKSVLFRSVISVEEVDVKALVKDKIATLGSNLKTEVDTMVQAFSRTVTTNKAQELGFDLFIYLGPTDKVTRPFCRKLLNKNPPIFTLEEIKAMDNGSDLPALQYGGGYNCRHQWRPISEEKAKALGYGS